MRRLAAVGVDASPPPADAATAMVAEEGSANAAAVLAFLDATAEVRFDEDEEGGATAPPPVPAPPPPNTRPCNRDVKKDPPACPMGIP